MEFPSHFTPLWVLVINYLLHLLPGVRFEMERKGKEKLSVEIGKKEIISKAL